ncbi:AAA family ATPase [Candidatus Micrarchaeota archaeon]|nr:AAA family ATPase [Candidatus Micrarchaeota archaeon]
MALVAGLTGENCAGKGTVADYLQKKGFYYLSLSDVIREELAAEGRDITRENLIAKGNELREKFGHGVLGAKTAAKLQSDKNYVIDSIRHPEEAKALGAGRSFVLVCVTAPPEKRFERMKARGRESDPKTLQAFLEIEKLEAKNKDKYKQQLGETMNTAGKKVVNDGDLKQLFNDVDKLLAEVSEEFKAARPSWDAYFMNIAKEVSKRSNCMKRHVAALIVKDKRIVSTGYNGTPRGTKNCDEGGCPRCNSFAESGTKLDECLCSHAEENAIVQAAYHGISIKDSTIYSTFAPCLTCSKMIINAGILEVVYNVDYPLNETVFGLLKQAGVHVRQFKVE